MTPEITSDLPPITPEPKTPERIAWESRIAKELASMFTYDICPVEGYLLRILDYDENGNATLWICPKCKNATPTPLKKKYNPHPRSYIEVTNDGIRECPLRAQEIANDLSEQYLFKTDRQTKTLYRYDDEKFYWRDDGTIYLQEILPKILGERNSEALFKNVLHCLKSITFEEIKPSKAVVSVDNGFLHMEKRCLISPTPNEFTLTRIPHKFDSEAKCPEITRVLTEIVGESQLPLLQESIGNVFILGSAFQKITVFIGSGGNGKGVVLGLITHLLGDENVSNVTLQALCSDKYERATCYRKLANLGRDVPQTKISATGNAKMMSGDDPMTMQNKYGQPFTAGPDDLPKQFYSCNQLPPSDDDTDAWYRRQKLITFNNRFTPGQNAVLRLADKLAENEMEMSGFLNLALDGRYRLLHTGCFSANENIEENRERYVKNSNPAQAFIEANLVFAEGKFIVEKDLWSKVGLWCSENSIASPRNKGVFTQELTKQLPQVVQTTARVLGKVTHVYMNVVFCNDCNDCNNPSLPLYRKDESNNIKSDLPVTPATKTLISNPEVDKNRFCGTDCGTYGKISCPWFTKKIPEDNPMPIKCYGWKAPLPTQEEGF